MNNHAFSKIWIIVVLIILIGGGIFAWQYFEIPKDEITNWQTYKNEEYEFEIKYPPDWAVELETPSYLCEGGPGYECLATIQFSPLSPLIKSLENIDLLIVTDPNNYSVVEWIEKYTPQVLEEHPETSLYKNVEIGENKWVKLVTKIGTGGSQGVAFSIAKNKKLYSFRIFSGEGWKEAEAILNKMLPTFRFTK